MRSWTFALTVTKPLTAGAVRSVVADLLPGLRVVATGRPDVPDDFGDVWVQVGPTHDPAWPVALDFSIFPDPSPLDPYPDLRLAEHLSGAFGVDVIAGTDDAIVPGLDPYDPYRCLAYVGGVWHLGSTDGMPLWGTYTDGTREFPGDEPLRLVRPVDPWA